MTAEPAPNARSLRQRDAEVIAEIARLRFSPLSLVGGRGNRLIEEGGREILDLSASAGPAALGYGHPAIVEAVAQATSNMAGASLLLYPNDNAVSLAETLLAITPGEGGRKVWFGHSGSDANDCAVRVLQAATGRTRFISFIGSYHGNLSGSMGVSGHTAMTHTLPRPGLVLLPYPDPFRPRFPAEAVLDLLDYQFETTCPPDQVAALFVEPLMSDGGLIVPPPGFLKALAARCRRHGIKLVVDEVKVGLGRSGLLHCFEHEEVVPDMVVFGKGLGGGLPLSALVGPRDIMDHAPAFALQTTAGNPVATAAGRVVVETILRERLWEHAARVGQVFADGLRALADRHACIGEVRGRGLAVGIDLVADRATRAPVPVTTTAKVIYRGYELGAAFSYVGLKGNVLEFTPPLTLTEAEAREGVAIVDQALADVAAGRVSDAAVAPFMMW
ncbi:aspartate aminotransferase family protein [Ancylobacter vacuolatus]|uniref:4-aminobutyrate aminotransferase n=1 Tax=Ancylobacter vacuolatus TaxID=223389 RepID=A0ABU0DKD8_9HYPH|nr:aspartate aminotransferase family protein [Ancylobacter vacuolatus]MDQ0348700.1 4-aminobutyrate aminotransferase [Ancylobacter vacuolatus]